MKQYKFKLSTHSRAVNITSYIEQLLASFAFDRLVVGRFGQLGLLDLF